MYARAYQNHTPPIQPCLMASPEIRSEVHKDRAADSLAKAYVSLVWILSNFDCGLLSWLVSLPVRIAAAITVFNAMPTGAPIGSIV